MTDYLVSMGLSEEISILIQVIVFGVGGILGVFKLIEYFIKFFKFLKPKKVKTKHKVSTSNRLVNSIYKDLLSELNNDIGDGTNKVKD